MVYSLMEKYRRKRYVIFRTYGIKIVTIQLMHLTSAMYRKAITKTTKVKIGVMISVCIVLLFGCSMSFNKRLTVDQVYVTYILYLKNGTFPPESLLTKINLYYDKEQMLYVKNVNDFALKYRDPSVVMTDRGLSIDFGLLPSAVLSSENEITLYFLPLKKGEINISGELIRRKKELFLGPRKPAVVIPIQAESAQSNNSYNREPETAEGFFEIIRKHNVQIETEYLKGRGINLFIPNERMTDAETELAKIMSDEGFKLKCSVHFDSGITGVYTKVLSTGKEIIEIRATIDSSGIGGGSLYIYAFGNTPVDEMTDRIAEEYRKRISVK